MKNYVQKISGLYAIADSTWNPFGGLSELVWQFLEGGCRIVQLRVKANVHDHAAKSAIHTAALEIMRLKKGCEFLFIINDYADVAKEVGADGVHVGENDMSVGEIRKRYGRDLIVGYSSHSIEEAMRAKNAGADYVAFGAIFPTKTKGPGHPVQGLGKLSALTEKMTIPVVAIGGINRNNITSVIDAGASAVAMISALSEAKDVAKETRWFVDRFSI